MTTGLNRRLDKVEQSLSRIEQERDERENPTPSIADILIAGRNREPVERTDEELRELGRNLRARLRANGVYDRRARR